MSAHTPLPWVTDCTDGDGFAYIGNPDRALVAIVQHDLVGSPGEATARANAELIVRSVNCHDELLRCLKEAVASWELADEDSDAEPEDGDALAEWKAVIAKAEGRS